MRANNGVKNVTGHVYECLNKLKNKYIIILVLLLFLSRSYNTQFIHYLMYYMRFICKSFMAACLAYNGLFMLLKIHSISNFF